MHVVCKGCMPSTCRAPRSPSHLRLPRFASVKGGADARWDRPALIHLDDCLCMLFCLLLLQQTAAFAFGAYRRAAHRPAGCTRRTWRSRLSGAKCRDKGSEPSCSDNTFSIDTTTQARASTTKSMDLNNGVKAHGSTWVFCGESRRGVCRSRGEWRRGGTRREAGDSTGLQT